MEFHDLYCSPKMRWVIIVVEKPEVKTQKEKPKYRR